ncbi:PAS domain-containing protein [Halothiobacillus sp. DCM-1]|uniref:PAS domain-containing protein n=1 Tax=Halothiobacillus sp. DCM-1 TaxID=3112558 RepID=UPI00324F59F5
MSILARLNTQHLKIGLMLLLSALIGGLVFQWLSEDDERQQHAMLVSEAERTAAALAPDQLQGKLKIVLEQLGLSSQRIKQDARGDIPLNTPDTLSLLANVGQRFGAKGVFIVGADGLIRSSWNEDGQHSTGLNVGFRPYFSAAMAGQSRLQAGISIARQDHSLYFAVPITETLNPLSPRIGVLVARSDFSSIVRQLAQAAPRAALISPGGVVFAATDPRWLDRGQNIRQPLPFSLQRSRQTIDGQVVQSATAALAWDDPAGAWQIILFRPLTASGASLRALTGGTIAAFLSLLLFSMLLSIRRVLALRQHSRQLLEAQLEQEASAAAFRSQINQFSLGLQQAKTLEELGTRFLSQVHQQSQSLLGVVYLLDTPSQTHLKRLASFACTPEPPAEWPVQAGLLGQAVREGQRQIHRTGTEVRWLIRSGLGAAEPVMVVSLPITLQQRVLGGVELGFAQGLDTDQLAALDEWLQLLAINIEILRRQQDVENLLLTEQALIDAIPYPLFFKGSDTRFLGFNRAYERAFGVERQSLIGKRVLDLSYLDEAERTAFQQEDERVIAEQSQVIRPIELVYADGKSHRLLYAISGFAAPDGRPGGLLGLLIDLPKEPS